MAMKQAGSWGEMIKAIEFEKKNLPWDPSKTNPVERVSIYERKREERKFDPVGMRYTDDNREAMFQTDKSNKMGNVMNTTLNKKKATWDIVAHQGPPRKHESLCKSNEVHPTDRPYNLLNGLDKKDHLSVPFQYNEEMVNHKIKHRKKNYIHIPEDNNMSRKFSIINNEYNDNSTSKRRQEDYDRTKQHVLKQYWATHDYNPIKGKYYDADKEKKYVEQGEIIRKVQGTAYLAKIPPSVLYSEGLSYNILNNSVYDEKRLVATNTVANLALNRMKVIPVEDKLKTYGEMEYTRDDERRLHRPSFKRWQGGIDRGYDVVNNTLYDGNNPAPLPTRPVTMWARVSINDQGGATEGGNAATSQFNQTAPARATYANDVIAMNSGRGLPGGRNLSGGLQLSNQHAQQAASSPMSHSYAEESVLSGGDSMYKGSPNQYQPSSSGYKPTNSVMSGSQAPFQRGYGSRTGTAVPSLDLGKASPKEKVTYTEPKGGGAGMSIPMVRTGGLSGLRD